MTEFPAPPPSVASAPPSRRRWLLWAIGAGLLVLVSVGVALALPLVSKGVHEINDSQRTLSAYLTAMKSEDVEAAEALLCDDLKPDLTPAALSHELAATREEVGALTSFTITNLMVKHSFGSGGRSTTAEASYTLHFARSTERHQALLVKTKDQWKVCGFQ